MYVLVGILQSVGMYYISAIYTITLLVAIVVVAAMVSQRNFCLTVGQKLVAEHQ